MRAIAVLVLFSATILAQPEPAFDVASIKRNTSLAEGGGGGPRPGGRYRLANVTTRSLISLAWGVPGNRVLGGPGWTATDRYDVDATMKENATPEETRAMMRTLLRDRFSLAVHTEQRELPVYLLVVARQGALGPGLERSTFDCSNLATKKQEAAAAQASRPGRMLCGFTLETKGVFDGGDLTMATLAQILTNQVGRPVIDRTGLTGGYNVALKWTPSLATDAPPADAVSIFTAVQEQLGLRLENGTAPLDVVVIDRIERPTDN